MRPACLDDCNVRCVWDDEVDECPCMDPEQPDPEPRGIENVPTRGLL